MLCLSSGCRHTSWESLLQARRPPMHRSVAGGGLRERRAAMRRSVASGALRERRAPSVKGSQYSLTCGSHRHGDRRCSNTRAGEVNCSGACGGIRCACTASGARERPSSSKTEHKEGRLGLGARGITAKTLHRNIKVVRACDKFSRPCTQAYMHTDVHTRKLRLATSRVGSAQVGLDRGGSAQVGLARVGSAQVGLALCFFFACLTGASR